MYTDLERIANSVVLLGKSVINISIKILKNIKK